MSRRSNSRPSRAVVARRQKIAGLLLLFAVLAVVWGRNALDVMPQSVRATSGSETTVAFDDADSAATRPVMRLSRLAGASRDPFVLDDTSYSKRPVELDPEPLLEPEPIEVSAPEPEAPAPDPGGLRLQGTFLGAEPKAMINGRTLRVGDTIDGFRIETIGNRRIVVVKDGFTFELDL